MLYGMPIVVEVIVVAVEIGSCGEKQSLAVDRQAVVGPIDNQARKIKWLIRANTLDC